jgi:hypothetical protein
MAAVGVEVKIHQHDLIAATTAPGGSIYEWRDDAAEEIVRVARATAPVSNPLNRQHRKWDPGGRFAAGFDWGRGGGNQYVSRAIIVNYTPHAEYVEFGRPPNRGRKMTFSWARSYIVPPGEVFSVTAVRGYDARHTLRNAANAVMPGMTGGVYTFLP